jgi:multidrug efflux pump
MCAKFLRPLNQESHGRLYRAGEYAFNSILPIYDRGLRWVLRHQRLMLAVTVGTACLSMYLYVLVPKGFFPQQDTGRIMGGIQAEQDISFQAIRDKMFSYVGIIMKDPAVNTVTGFVGGGGTANTGRMFITLKPLEQRKVNADQVINRLRGKLASVPGATLFLQAAQDLQIGGRMGNAQYQYTLQSESLDDLNLWAPQVLARLRKLPLLRDVNTDQQNRGLSAQVMIDRDTAARLGIQPAAIDAALYQAFGQAQVSTIYEELNQYHVVMEVDPKYQQSPDALQAVYVRSNTNVQAHFETSNTALAVNHQGQFPSVTLSFNLAPGVSLGQATEAIRQVERDINMPATIHAGFQGTAAAFQDSLASEPILILTALVKVYVVLGILYESYIHPITILSTLPSAGVGAILALQMTRNELNVIGLIGVLLLIGIVKKNAIMMIDFALDAERREGKSSEDAIYQACVLRFRPIMMTTMAALLAGLPLAMGTGTGSELYRPWALPSLADSL